MPASIFDDLLVKGIRAGEVPGRTEEAREWYRNRAKNVSRARVSEQRFRRDLPERMQQDISFGSMYMFSYDPKLKNTLPYYDQFPLVFPINTASGGFLGMNMHYLPPQLRARLMDSLYGTVTNQRYDQSTTLRISYDILNSAAKFNLFKPTIKHYLYKQVRSRFIYVEPSEWDIALFLPTAKWAKAGSATVYADARRKIRG